MADFAAVVKELESQNKVLGDIKRNTAKPKKDAGDRETERENAASAPAVPVLKGNKVLSCALTTSVLKALLLLLKPLTVAIDEGESSERVGRLEAGTNLKSDLSCESSTLPEDDMSSSNLYHA